MSMSAEHKSKFTALHRQWWRLHMSEKFLSGTKNPKQTHTSLKNWVGWVDFIFFFFFIIENMFVLYSFIFFIF